MNKFNPLMLLIGILILSGCANQEKKTKTQEEETVQTSYQLPPNNPFIIQNSAYGHVHFDAAATDATKIPSWKGNRTISEEKVKWLPWVATIGTGHRPYENGEEALFVSGTNKIGKIKITNGDFSWVDEITVPGFDYETPSVVEMEQTVQTMKAAGTNEEKYLPPLTKHLQEIRQSGATLMNGVYVVTDHEGNYYAGFGTTVYKVSDKIPGDVNSEIEITASYNLKDGLPPEEAEKISRLVAISMTYDGYLAIAMPGIIAVLDRDLKKMEYLLIEDEAVDNGISIDKDGGIYCVTSKYMRKLVWDGNTLSDKEEDGAWKSTYDDVPNPKSLSRGAGNTPALMGFGPDEDKLVFLADAGEKIKVVAFWRDEIPDDFKQKPGTKSRRIADQLELTIDVPATIEWSPHVYGNGVMMMASAWPDPVYDQEGKLLLFETVLTAGATRQAPNGVEKWSWDKESRTLKSDWTVMKDVQWTLSPVSETSNSVGLTLFEDGVYSLMTVDWDTGKELGKTILGANPIFNTVGGLFIPIDENRIYVTGVFGPVMINK